MNALTSITEDMLRQLRTLDASDRAVVLGRVLAIVMDDNETDVVLPLNGHNLWLAQLFTTMQASARMIGRQEALSIELPADELAARIAGRRGQS